jgi:hypothetical protein
VNKKGITLRGIFGRRLWDTWEQLLLLLQSGRIELDWLVTHRMSLDDAEAAVDLLTGDAGKVFLVPGKKGPETRCRAAGRPARHPFPSQGRAVQLGRWPEELRGCQQALIANGDRIADCPADNSSQASITRLRCA